MGRIGKIYKNPSKESESPTTSEIAMYTKIIRNILWVILIIVGSSLAAFKFTFNTEQRLTALENQKLYSPSHQNPIDIKPIISINIDSMQCSYLFAKRNEVDNLIKFNCD